MIIDFEYNKAVVGLLDDNPTWEQYETLVPWRGYAVDGPDDDDRFLFVMRMETPTQEYWAGDGWGCASQSISVYRYDEECAAIAHDGENTWVLCSPETYAKLNKRNLRE